MFDESMLRIARFGASDGTEFVRLVAVLSLGMCRSVSQGVLAPDYACDRLFLPVLAARTQELSNSAMLVEALTLATELDDVARLAPHGLGRLLADLESRFLMVLRDCAPAGLESDRWLVPRD